MKKLILLFTFALVFSFVANKFMVSASGCAISCAAVCRYICDASDKPASCTLQSYNNAVANCCAGAFANTPGINDVPCTLSGNEV
jgi:hypothetical protein